MKYLFLNAFSVLLFAHPSWAKEPLTFEQARAMALDKVPGVIVDTERSIHNGAVVFEFDIKLENGAVMDIEIDSVTHEILRLVVDETGTGSSLPEPAILKDEANAIAVEYIEDNTSGLRRVDVLSSQYTIVDGRLVYIMFLKRGITDYSVTVDANSGRVIDFKEE